MRDTQVWAGLFWPKNDGLEIVGKGLCKFAVEECDVTELEALRAQLNANKGEGAGSRPKLTILPLLITAICKTLPDFPMINARYDDEAGVVTRHGAVNLGMAAQTDAGLMGLPTVTQLAGALLRRAADRLIDGL